MSPGGAFSITGYTYSHDGVARLLARLSVIPHLEDVSSAPAPSRSRKRPLVEVFDQRGPARGAGDLVKAAHPETRCTRSRSSSSLCSCWAPSAISLSSRRSGAASADPGRPDRGHGDDPESPTRGPLGFQGRAHRGCGPLPRHQGDAGQARHAWRAARAEQDRPRHRDPLWIDPPGDSADAGRYMRQPIDVIFEGSFYELSDFLYRVRTLVSVNNGRLRATGRLFTVGTLSFVKAEQGFLQIEATLGIDAYVYGTGAATPPGATPPAAQPPAARLPRSLCPPSPPTRPPPTRAQAPPEPPDGRRSTPRPRPSARRSSEVLGLVLVGVLIFQAPKILGMFGGSSSTTASEPAATPPPAPAAPTPATPGAPRPATPAAAATGAMSWTRTPAPVPSDGQLVTFDRFESKDPFVPQVTDARGRPGAGASAPTAATREPQSRSRKTAVAQLRRPSRPAAGLEHGLDRRERHRARDLPRRIVPEGRSDLPAHVLKKGTARSASSAAAMRTARRRSRWRRAESRSR